MYKTCVILSMVLVFNFFISFFAFANDKIVIGVNILEPWRMKNDGIVEGPDIEVAKKIAEKLSLTLEFRHAPFIRCLAWMKEGSIDMMMGLLKNEEREAYIHFIEPYYKSKSNKSFYVLKGNKNLITKYEDLYGLKIGVKRGAKYFPQFDEDKKLNKFPVNDYKQNFEKLIAKRIDTFIITKDQGEYLINKLGYQGFFEEAAFSFIKKNFVYIGISKKSHLLNQTSQANKIIATMIQNGEIDSLIKNWFHTNKLPAPDYK